MLKRYFKSAFKCIYVKKPLERKRKNKRSPERVEKSQKHRSRTLKVNQNTDLQLINLLALGFYRNSHCTNTVDRDVLRVA